MATVITSDTDTITADAVSDYQSHRRSGNRVNSIMGRANPDGVLRVASLRTGTMTLNFHSETDSAAAEALHAQAGRVFVVTSAERPTVDMAYMVADQGDIGRTLTDDGRWVLTIDFQEVSV
jgi:hypothetical protein